MATNARSVDKRLALALTGVVIGGSWLAFAPASEAQAQSAQGDEIVVTAQRRATAVMDTPEALTAVRGETLEAIGGEGLADLPALAPSLTYSENFGISQIFIRGVGNSFFSPGGDPGVALYADGVYLSDQEATGVAFLDVERVEVLRGPQGALYGRNATGGAINIISRGPSSDPEASVSLAAGDFGRREADAVVSGALSPGLLARFAIQYRNLDGYADNELATGPSELDGEDSLAGRLTILADIGGGELALTLNALTQDDVGPGLKILADPTPQPAELLFGLRPSVSERDYISQISANERDVGSITAQWRRSIPGADLTVIADHRRSDRVITYDQDGTAATQSVTSLDTTSDQSSLDAYVASAGDGALEWLVGATYIAFDQSRTTTVSGALPGAFINPLLPVTTPVPFLFEGGGDLESRAWAVYGEGTLALTPRLSARVGLRYNSDEKSIDEFLNFFGPVTGSQSESWNEWSGRVGLEFRPTEDLLLYATASRGFKAGALNLGAFTPPVDPEIILNYEAGAKFTSADGRLDLSASVFTSDYADLQVVQIGPLSQILSNAAQASISGLELEGVLRPIEGLRVGLTASWLDASFDEFSATDQRRGFALFNLAGNQLPLTSEWQLGALVSYEWVAPGGGTFAATGNYSWRSEYFFTEFNTNDARQDSFGRLDLGLSWTAPSERWSVSAIGRNLTDETTIGSLSVVSPLLGSVRVAAIDPPRHFMVRLGYQFR
ncbi:MAG: TonB-dependent receptor [Caulobacterales bacterium]|jgi:iron complex outermembrane receptor protein